jgi:uncharacterized protein YggU (UPF0235/DUF167 family)
VLEAPSTQVDTAKAAYSIYVRERAVDGMANDAVARVLAAHLQLPTSRVECWKSAN